MRQLTTPLVHLFQNIDYLSMLCLITLEDLENEENFLFVYNNPKLHRQKNVKFIEQWSQEKLDHLSLFLEHKKFVSKKTCLCNVCTDNFGRADDNKIFSRILNSTSVIIAFIEEMPDYGPITRTDKVYLNRLSTFIYNIQKELHMEYFRDVILSDIFI